MFKPSDTNRLKVCCTCRHWSYKYKGFCHHLEQGVGKFWMCEDWSPVAAEGEGSLPEARESIRSATLRA